MTRLLARTRDEAQLYMDRTPCVCGDIEFERASAVIDDHGVLCRRYAGSCRSCNRQREFVFQLPDAPWPVSEAINFGGDEPSQLLDPGEWLNVADYHARLDPSTRRDVEIAAAAIAEVLKFARGEDCILDDAFWTERGRAVRDREPGRFRVIRLEAVLSAYRGILAKS